MSKIICDVCGTSYPETSTQCPICGSVRPGEVVAVEGNTDGADKPKSTYTYVKGGRFSKANVKKRNQGKVYLPEDSLDSDDEMGNNTGNRGLVVVVIVLLAAIIAVVGFICFRLFGPERQPNLNVVTPGTSAAATTEQTEPTESVAVQIPCTDIVASKKEIRFDKAGAAVLLNVTTMPKDTTDAVAFASSDEEIATVTDGGKVTAVAPGEAMITITCGAVSTQCAVICDFEGEQTATTAPAVDTSDFELNREDFTLNKKGEEWKLYNGDIPKDQITWSSDNEKVVTVKDGVVKAVGTGSATITAECGDVKLTCVVRCSAAVGPYEEKTEEEEQSNLDYKINKTDVTIKVNETFELTLTDKEGKVIEVTWTPGDPNVCAVEGNTIKALSAGITTVTTIYEGVPYACTVRVN